MERRGREMDGLTTHSAIIRKGRKTRGPMPGCAMHSKPKLAEYDRCSSLLRIQ